MIGQCLNPVMDVLFIETGSNKDGHGGQITGVVKVIQSALVFFTLWGDAISFYISIQSK